MCSWISKFDQSYLHHLVFFSILLMSIDVLGCLYLLLESRSLKNLCQWLLPHHLYRFHPCQNINNRNFKNSLAGVLIKTAWCHIQSANWSIRKDWSGKFFVLRDKRQYNYTNLHLQWVIIIIIYYLDAIRSSTVTNSMTDHQSKTDYLSIKRIGHW